MMTASDNRYVYRILALLMALGLLLALQGCDDGGTVQSVDAADDAGSMDGNDEYTCGDGTCDPGEDCDTCVADCGCDEGLTCLAAECVAQDCEPNETKCNGQEVLTCGSDGQWKVKSVCAADKVCFEEHCCAPDCMGKQCGDDGCGGTCGTCIADEKCVGGSCLECQTNADCTKEGEVCSGGECIPSGPACGDGECNGEETMCDCPDDCGTCPGCCDAAGVCKGGDELDACGKNGADCDACNADEACDDGECQETQTECGDGDCGEEENCYACPDDCGECTGDCCESNGTPGCEDTELTACVCGLDDYCCSSAWDDVCVGEAIADCGAVCGPAECGDGTCNGDEDCETCPEDCEECPGDCGDGDCGEEENCYACPEDCGECTGDCCESNGTPGCEDADLTACVCELDGYCCSSEWDGICVQQAMADCDAPCGPFCGDGLCDDTEDCETCPEDCDECPGDCGNGDCGEEENCHTCPDDCGECTGDCCESNGTPGCEDTELTACVCGLDDYCCDTEWDQFCVDKGVAECEADCGPLCGDGLCDDAEDCETCPEDCGECPPVCGDGDCEGDENKCNCAGDCGTCSGCCMPDDTCKPGDTEVFCGKGGGDCTSCPDQNICLSGECTPGSCQNKCGAPGSPADAKGLGYCYCDEKCESLGDCCPDICSKCSQLTKCISNPTCESGWTMKEFSYGILCYRAYDNGKTWQAAEAVCTQSQAHLVSIHSGPENEFIFDVLNMGAFDNDDFWVGLHQVPPNSAPDENWVWSDGTPLVFTKWANGEPNDNGGAGTENCAQVFGDTLDWGGQGNWNDQTCDTELEVVCKKPAQ